MNSIGKGIATIGLCAMVVGVCIYSPSNIGTAISGLVLASLFIWNN